MGKTTISLFLQISGTDSVQLAIHLVDPWMYEIQSFHHYVFECDRDPD